MSLDHCAALVAAEDPDRFRAAMLAPVASRGHLLALYAFNLELARAAWAPSEPMLSEMRVQWWADELDRIYRGKTPEHEILTPLKDTINACALPRAPFDDILGTRRFDAAPRRAGTVVDVEARVAASAGSLMWLAALTLKASPEVETTIRNYGTGAGMVLWLEAEPAMLAANRGIDLSNATPPETAAPLAARAATLVDAARSKRKSVPKPLHPAVLAGTNAAARLTPNGTARQSELKKRIIFLWAAQTGRW